MSNLIDSNDEWAVRTPAETFHEDVQRDIRSLAARRERPISGADQCKKDRCRRETALHIAWQEFTEYHGREAALEVLAEAEGVHCPLAKEWFLSLSQQVEEMGL